MGVGADPPVRQEREADVVREAGLRLDAGPGSDRVEALFPAVRAAERHAAPRLGRDPRPAAHPRETFGPAGALGQGRRVGRRGISKARLCPPPRRSTLMAAVMPAGPVPTRMQANLGCLR